MSRAEDTEAALSRDIATLRALIDRLLDQGSQPQDSVLIAASLVLNAKLAQLHRHAPRP